MLKIDPTRGGKIEEIIPSLSYFNWLTCNIAARCAH